MVAKPVSLVLQCDSSYGGEPFGKPRVALVRSLGVTRAGGRILALSHRRSSGDGLREDCPQSLAFTALPAAVVLLWWTNAGATEIAEAGGPVA